MKTLYNIIVHIPKYEFYSSVTATGNLRKMIAAGLLVPSELYSDHLECPCMVYLICASNSALGDNKMSVNQSIKFIFLLVLCFELCI
jgi:hypothetical protein